MKRSTVIVPVMIGIIVAMCFMWRKYPTHVLLWGYLIAIATTLLLLHLVYLIFNRVINKFIFNTFEGDTVFMPLKTMRVFCIGSVVLLFIDEELTQFHIKRNADRAELLAEAYFRMYAKMDTEKAPLTLRKEPMSK